MKPFYATLLKIKREFDRDNARGLVCKAGYYGSCPVLKLQKPHWTNDIMDSVQNQTGIFFSIWLDNASVRTGRALYNIHALKLRRLKNYSITSIDFAKHFRQSFAAVASSWPNVTTDYGPQTLMEGWIDFDSAGLEKPVCSLIQKFAKVSPMIDALLAARQK